MSCRADRTMPSLSFALRSLLRDLKSGELAVLVAALLVAVASLTAVGFFTSRIGLAVERQAGEVLAADLRLESPRPLARHVRSRGTAPRPAQRAGRVDAERGVRRRRVVAGGPARRRARLSAARPPEDGRPRVRHRRRHRRHSRARRGLGGFAAAGPARRRTRRRRRRRRPPAARHARARLPSRPGQRLRRSLRRRCSSTWPTCRPPSWCSPAAASAARCCSPASRRRSTASASGCRAPSSAASA